MLILSLREIQEMESSPKFYLMMEGEKIGWKEEYFSHNDVINVGHPVKYRIQSNLFPSLLDFKRSILRNFAAKWYTLDGELTKDELPELQWTTRQPDILMSLMIFQPAPKLTLHSFFRTGKWITKVVPSWLPVGNNTEPLLKGYSEHWRCAKLIIQVRGSLHWLTALFAMI